MKNTTSRGIRDLNEKVHDLNYTDSKGAKRVVVKVDPVKGKALAEKIRENIRAYQNEITTPSRPSRQAL